jgi:hypothetical protein
MVLTHLTFKGSLHPAAWVLGLPALGLITGAFLSKEFGTDQGFMMAAGIWGTDVAIGFVTFFRRLTASERLKKKSEKYWKEKGGWGQDKDEQGKTAADRRELERHEQKQNDIQRWMGEVWQRYSAKAGRLPNPRPEYADFSYFLLGWPFLTLDRRMLIILKDRIVKYNAESKTIDVDVGTTADDAPVRAELITKHLGGQRLATVKNLTVFWMESSCPYFYHRKHT